MFLFARSIEAGLEERRIRLESAYRGAFYRMLSTAFSATLLAAAAHAAIIYY